MWNDGENFDRLAEREEDEREWEWRQEQKHQQILKNGLYKVTNGILKGCFGHFDSSISNPELVMFYPSTKSKYHQIYLKKENLKKVSVEEMRSRGYTCYGLLKIGFTIDDLIKAGYSVLELYKMKLLSEYDLILKYGFTETDIKNIKNSNL